MKLTNPKKTLLGIIAFFILFLSNCDLGVNPFDSDCSWITGEGCPISGEQMSVTGFVYFKEDSSIAPNAFVYAYHTPTSSPDTIHVISNSEGQYHLQYRVRAHETPYPQKMYTFARWYSNDSTFLSSTALTTHIWRDGYTRYVDYYLE